MIFDDILYFLWEFYNFCVTCEKTRFSAKKTQFWAKSRKSWWKTDKVNFFSKKQKGWKILMLFHTSNVIITPKLETSCPLEVYMPSKNLSLLGKISKKKNFEKKKFFFEILICGIFSPNLNRMTSQTSNFLQIEVPGYIFTINALQLWPQRMCDKKKG